MRYFFLFTLMFLPYGGLESNGIMVFAPAAELKGIDVSHHQKQIEWDSVVTHEKIDFAFVKATEGADFSDSMFCRNWADLQRLGIKRGAYHFFRGYRCGEEQAMHFLRQVDMVEGDLPPVLDVETLDGSSPEALAVEMHSWLQLVRAHLAVKPIIYSSQNFYENFLADKGFDEYPLWIARYSSERPSLMNGRQFNFWQYSKEGCIEGISKKVDLNIFPGTPEMLDEMSYRNVMSP